VVPVTIQPSWNERFIQEAIPKPLVSVAPAGLVGPIPTVLAPPKPIHIVRKEDDFCPTLNFEDGSDSTIYRSDAPSSIVNWCPYSGIEGHICEMLDVSGDSQISESSATFFGPINSTEYTLPPCGECPKLEDGEEFSSPCGCHYKQPTFWNRGLFDMSMVVFFNLVLWCFWLLKGLIVNYSVKYEVDVALTAFLYFFSLWHCSKSWREWRDDSEGWSRPCLKMRVEMTADSYHAHPEVVMHIYVKSFGTVKDVARLTQLKNVAESKIREMFPRMSMIDQGVMTINAVRALVSLCDVEVSIINEIGSNSADLHQVHNFATRGVTPDGTQLPTK